jgi:hypothetical protein
MSCEVWILFGLIHNARNLRANFHNIIPSCILLVIFVEYLDLKPERLITHKSQGCLTCTSYYKVLPYIVDSFLYSSHDINLSSETKASEIFLVPRTIWIGFIPSARTYLMTIILGYAGLRSEFLCVNVYYPSKLLILTCKILFYSTIILYQRIHHRNIFIPSAIRP